MSSLPKLRFTPEEYLERERKADFKSEYFAGEIFAMAGAGEDHNLIVANVVAELRTQLKGRPCKTYPSDMKVEIGAAGLFAYPDVSVVCGEARFRDDHRDMLLNPNVIIEVLSPSTEGYGRGVKFAQYRRLESLTDYIMISPNEYRIEHYVRQPDNHWLLSEAVSAHATVTLPSIGCGLLLSEVYDRVEFDTHE